MDWTTHNNALCFAHFGRSGKLLAALEAGGDFLSRNAHGWSPLDSATRGGHLTCATMLLDAGAPIDGRMLGDFYPGYTPLMVAVAHAQLPMAEMLLFRGTNTGLVDAEGKSALDVCLSMASQRAHNHPMRTLLEAWVLAAKERTFLEASIEGSTLPPRKKRSL
jgi:ankyrin repeat protein